MTQRCLMRNLRAWARAAVFLLASINIAHAGVYLQSWPGIPALAPSVANPTAQAFSGNVATPTSVLPGNVSFIWSTGNGGGPYHISPVAGVSSGGYWPLYANNYNFNINGVYTAQYNFYWFQSNHPDWIAYKCDRSTPAFRSHEYTTSVTHNSTSVTITSPSYDTDDLAAGNVVFGGTYGSAGTTVAAYPGSGATAILADPYTGSTGSVELYWGGTPLSTTLNIAMPAVQTWVLGYLGQYLSAGFGGLNIDNVNVSNYGNQCGWFAGAQTETNTIVGAANNGSGKVRLTLGTSTANFADGSGITVSGVGGTTEANGSWIGTLINSTHIDIPVSFVNAFTSAGTTIYANGPAPAFGGSWVQPYTGLRGANVFDRSFAEAAIRWACRITNFAHTFPGGGQYYTIGNVFDVGFDFDTFGATNEPAYSYEQRAADCFDIFASESTFYHCKLSTPSTRNCEYLTDSAFARAFLTNQTLTRRKGWWFVEYPPCSVGTNAYSCINLSRTADEVYATALWLLLRDNESGPPSYWSPIGFLNNGTGTDHSSYVPLDPSWTPAVGTPLPAGPYPIGQACQERMYTTGQVDVNASSANPCTYTVPTGAHDQFGNAVAPGPATLQPMTASVLTHP